MGETLTREQLDRSIKACPPSDMRTVLQMARASLDLQERNTWLLARWEELYDVLALTGPVRHPVDATEQVRIQRDDLTVAERRARRWEAFARRIWARLDDEAREADALATSASDGWIAAEAAKQDCYTARRELAETLEAARANADALILAGRELGEVRANVRKVLTCKHCNGHGYVDVRRYHPAADPFEDGYEYTGREPCPKCGEIRKALAAKGADHE